MKRLLAILLLAAPAFALDEKAVREAIHSLGDPQSDRREAASRQLLDWGCEAPEQILPLLTACSSDPDLEVRDRADSLLRRIPWEPRCRAALALSGDPGWKQAVEALFENPTTDTLCALAQIGPHPAAAEVIEGFLGHESPTVRCMAVLFLGNLKEGAHVSRLVPLLADSQELVRESAACTLVALDLGKKESGVLLGPYLRHAQPGTRAQAAFCLGSLGGRSSLRDLLPLLEDEWEPVRSKAAQSVGMLSQTLNDRSILPDLLKLLEAKLAGTRMASAQALSLLKDPSSLPALAALLEDADPQVPPFAAQSMGRIAGQSWACDAAGVEAARAWWAAHKER